MTTDRAAGEGALNKSTKSTKDDHIVDLLLQEYKLLQDKMDKIGSFRFTIKGWAITLATGSALGALATSLTKTNSVLLVGGLLFTFWVLEIRQVRLTDIFSDRALRIENAIEKRLRKLGFRRSDFLGLVRIPGTANEILSPPDKAALRRRSVLARLLRRALSKRKLRKRWYGGPVLGVKRRVSSAGKWIVKSDIYFYALILLALWVFFTYHHTSKHQDEPKSSPKLLPALCLPDGLTECRGVTQGGRDG